MKPDISFLCAGFCCRGLTGSERCDSDGTVAVSRFSSHCEVMTVWDELDRKDMFAVSGGLVESYGHVVHLLMRLKYFCR